MINKVFFKKIFQNNEASWMRLLLISSLIFFSGCSKKGSSGTSSAGNNSTVTSLSKLSPVSLSVNSPYTSNASSFTLSGTCADTATVYLSGSETNSSICAQNSFSFTLTPQGSGTNTYYLIQKANGALDSSTVRFDWVINTNLPSNVEITTPNIPVTYSNQNSIQIDGSCITGHTVTVGGDVSSGDITSPANSLSQTCSNSIFSFIINKSSDHLYQFSLTQTDPLSLNTSGTVTIGWERDTVAPTNLTVDNPTGRSSRTKNNNQSISGLCENQATVKLSGRQQLSAPCTNGSFSFNVEETSDGNYHYDVIQTDRAGNDSSPPLGIDWVRDTVLSQSLSITNQNTSICNSTSCLSNTSSLTLIGSCEAGGTVNISGPNNYADQTICGNSNTYTLTISKTGDGTYNYILYQTDTALNTSSNLSYSWTIDTTVNAPEVLNFSGSSVTSSDPDITLSVSCEAGATVNMSVNSTSQQKACSSSPISFSFTPGSGVSTSYSFSLTQTDLAGNVSSNTVFTWNKTVGTPTTPVITSTNPFFTNTSSTDKNTMTISGTCTTGNTVTIINNSSVVSSTTCTANSFSNTVSQSSDGTYNYSVKQTLYSVDSASVSVTWTRKTTVPNAPTVTSITNPRHYSNSSTISVGGACENDALVSINGDTDAATKTCVNASYSFTVTKADDANYTFYIDQTDTSGNKSLKTEQIWTRDTITPAEVTLYNPITNPYRSYSSSVDVTATCTPNETNVFITGNGADSNSPCPATGKVIFTVSKSVDGTYDYTIYQKDFAGNATTGISFRWQRDSSLTPSPMFQPTVSTPTNNNPYLSNTSTMDLYVTCDPNIKPSKAIVNISGDVSAAEITSPANSLSQTCTASPVKFTIQKSTDGLFKFDLNQYNPNNNIYSANTRVEWNRKTSLPAAPAITTPALNTSTIPSSYVSSGNLTIIGTCEANATVTISNAYTGSVVCDSNNAFRFDVTKSVDGDYVFDLKQTDLYSNNSLTTSFKWTRFIGTVNTPVVLSPNPTSITNGASSLTIFGSCTTNQTITIGGNVTASEVTNPSNSLTQTCSNSQFLYMISKTVDGVYSFNLTQKYLGVTSTSTTVTWTRNTRPVTQILSGPTSPNIGSSASFTFNSTTSGVTFQCRLDTTATWTSCTSGTAIQSSTITNGARTYYVRAVDASGNIGDPATFSWTQAVYNTMALYHLNTSTTNTSLHLTDSSSYASLFSNTLVPGTTTLATEDTTGVQLTIPPGTTTSKSSRIFGTSKYYTVANNNALNLGLDKLTLELRVKWSTYPATANYWVLLSKTNGSSGWELRLRRLNTAAYYFDFVVYLNGTTPTIVSSSSLGDITAAGKVNTWHYLAVTYNLGTVNFSYAETTSLSNFGSGIIGTAGSTTIPAGTGPFRIGANSTPGVGNSLWFPGSIDEVRISKIIRTPAYTTSEYTAD